MNSHNTIYLCRDPSFPDNRSVFAGEDEIAILSESNGMVSSIPMQMTPLLKEAFLMER